MKVEDFIKIIGELETDELSTIIQAGIILGSLPKEDQEVIDKLLKLFVDRVKKKYGEKK